MKKIKLLIFPLLALPWLMGWHDRKEKWRKRVKEGREMSLSDESEPKFKTMWICPQCGWLRPEPHNKHGGGFKSKTCGKCNSSLVPKIVKVEDCELNPAHYIRGFTKEYQDARWRACRYGKDLRGCLEYHSKNVNGELVIFCKADNHPCSARWMGDIDE